MDTRKSVKTSEPKISEKSLAYIWQYQLVSNLRTDDGEELKVIFPGRLSSDSGGDFKDAVFIIGNNLVYGDIELHVRSSDWYAHGHDRNPAYNGVVLHVVMWHDNKSPTKLECGSSIPIVMINSLLNRLHRSANGSLEPLNISKTSCTEIKSYRDRDNLIEILVCAGRKRFSDRVIFYDNELKRLRADEVLFGGIAGALGYTNNKMQFEKVAKKIISSGLNNFISKDKVAKRALLIGTAGLLPSQRSSINNEILMETEAQVLEDIWRETKTINNMNFMEWNFYRVRPDNHPVRRLVALSCLIDRYSQQGLSNGMLKLIKEKSENKPYRYIENGLLLFCGGYWSNHIDFGFAKSKKTAILGRGRAREIIINVLLPFAFAWGEFVGKYELRDSAYALYQQYPGLQENQLTHHMKTQFMKFTGFALSACQQQGLIHIFKMYCRYRNCTECMVKVRC